ncbi:MAG: XdhC family protein [Anaerolineales bacterium]|nr:MAG: XdhC family protein [Anaerolineales bacterium]
MRELLPDLEHWLAKGERVALCTVISTWGSAPRQAGAVMAVSESGSLVGSVSGGCVEGAVLTASKQIIESKQPQLLHFGVQDDTAWEVGLACGGEIDVFVQPLDEQLFAELLPRLKADQPMTLSTNIKGDGLGGQTLADEAGQPIASTGIAPAPRTARIAGLQPDGDDEIFVNPLAASPTLILVGASHVAAALVNIAHMMEFRVVVIDPRKAFMSEERFANADKLVPVWPQLAFEDIGITNTTAIALLSHDPKIDEPGLMVALRSPAFYVGALGSRRVQAQRRERLLKAGLTEQELERLHAPIGLAIKAKTPEEIALSIMAEIIQNYRAE